MKNVPGEFDAPYLWQDDSGRANGLKSQFSRKAQERILLFVRSVRVDKAGTVFGAKTHSWPSLYGYYRGNTEHTDPTTTSISFSQQDEVAIGLLRKAGVSFDMVDLSSGVRARLSARPRGVRETPTLLVENGSPRRYEGAKAIAKFVAETGSKN